MEERRVKANGIDFAYLEEGRGPTVFLLHGFPDNAHTWSHQIPALSAAGYRVVAPFLRGYPPTQIPDGGYYGRSTLALDVKELILALGGGEPVFLVGQDWGAGITYNVIAAFPELVRRALAMAIPHSAQIRRCGTSTRRATGRSACRPWRCAAQTTSAARCWSRRRSSSWAPMNGSSWKAAGTSSTASGRPR